MSRLQYKKILANTLLTFSSLALAVLISEFTLRLIFTEFYIWPPRLTEVYHPSSELLPGVKGDSYFRTNSLGIRGREIPKENGHRIITIGGSTTECIYLDQTETWSHLIEQNLTKDGFNAWVGNIGRSGLTTRGHIFQLEHALPQYGKIDSVVLLVGINDLQMRLEKDDNFKTFMVDKEAPLPSWLNQVFSIYPVWSVKDHAAPFIKKTALWYFAKKFLNFLQIKPYQLDFQDKHGEIYQRNRARRANAEVIRDYLPDLNEALVEYRSNLHKIIDLAKEAGIEPILLTQPVMWDQNLGEELQNLLWFGWIGDRDKTPKGEYYSISALKAGMDQYNKVLLGVCQAREIHCFDLASKLARDTTVFYDDCHFNEQGSNTVAELLSNYLQNNVLK